jgi:hypothetical protein
MSLFLKEWKAYLVAFSFQTSMVFLGSSFYRNWISSETNAQFCNNKKGGRGESCEK